LPKKLEVVEPLDGFSLLAILEYALSAGIVILAAAGAGLAGGADALEGALAGTVVDGAVEVSGLSLFNLNFSFVVVFTYGFDPESFSRPKIRVDPNDVTPYASYAVFCSCDNCAFKPYIRTNMKQTYLVAPFS